MSAPEEGEIKSGSTPCERGRERQAAAPTGTAGDRTMRGILACCGRSPLPSPSTAERDPIFRREARATKRNIRNLCMNRDHGAMPHARGSTKPQRLATMQRTSARIVIPLFAPRAGLMQGDRPPRKGDSHVKDGNAADARLKARPSGLVRCSPSVLRCLDVATGTPATPRASDSPSQSGITIRAEVPQPFPQTGMGAFKR